MDLTAEQYIRLLEAGAYDRRTGYEIKEARKQQRAKP
jgi:hypothetical protein